MRSWNLSLLRSRALVPGISILLAYTGNAFSGFVTASGTNFMLDGEVFYFGGGCSYEMTSSTATADKELEIVRKLRLNAIRIWGFDDGNEGGFQPNARDYNEARFAVLDYVIAKCEEYGVKIVLPLVNNWPEYGGVPQYLEWSPTASEHADFFTDAECKDIYKDYVTYVLNRTNTITGLQYKDEPAIMIVEVMNEARGGAGNETVLAAWFNEMAGFIKTIDNNHLVGTGSEGFYLHNEDYTVPEDGYPDYGWRAGGHAGTDFFLNNASDNIDVISIHIWADQWAITQYSLAQFAEYWVDAHKADADAIGKPIYIGEFGISIDRTVSDLSLRDSVYEQTYRSALENNYGGTLFWHMMSETDPAAAPLCGVATFADESTNEIILAYSDSILARNNTVLPADTDPPVISTLKPSGVVYETTATLSLVTDEQATIRYSTTDQAYDDMTDQFAVGENRWFHSTPVAVTDGQAYTFYVRAQDKAGNTTQESSLISFRVNAHGTMQGALLCRLDGLSDDVPVKKAGVVTYAVGNGDMSGGVRVSAKVLLADAAVIPDTAVVYARFYIKTGKDFTWSAATETVPLVPGEWVTVEQMLTVFDNAIDLSYVRALGLQFLPDEGSTMSGDILVDDVRFMTHSSVLYESTFGDDANGWTEANLGTSAVLLLQHIDANEYGSSAIRDAARPFRGSSIAGIVTVDRKLILEFAKPLAERTDVAVYSISGKMLTATSLCPGTQRAVAGTMESANGAYLVSISSSGVKQVEKLIHLAR